MTLRSSRLLLTAAMTLLAVPVLLATPPASAGSAKVDICHIPPGNYDNFHTITVSENALPAHLAHGDVEGACVPCPCLGIGGAPETLADALDDAEDFDQTYPSGIVFSACLDNVNPVDTLYGAIVDPAGPTNTILDYNSVDFGGGPQDLVCTFLRRDDGNITYNANIGGISEQELAMCSAAVRALQAADPLDICP